MGTDLEESSTGRSSRQARKSICRSSNGGSGLMRQSNIMLAHPIAPDQMHASHTLVQHALHTNAQTRVNIVQPPMLHIMFHTQKHAKALEQSETSHRYENAPYCLP